MRSYLKLITSQHRTANKFCNHINLITKSLAETASFARQLNNYFSLDDAVGVQLDVIGEWAGISRRVLIPLVGVYFTLDNDRTGFDEGMWKGEFDSDSGFMTLNDETYRSIIRVKIKANHWDGTTESLMDIYDSLLPDEDTKLFFIDNLDMSMDVFITGSYIDNVTKSIVKQGYLGVKPEGVQVNHYYINSVPKSPMFGFDISNNYIAGFDTAGFAVPL
ncbi:DUF2612 domain-containing protein [Moellerella wisconsensis]|uniref:DUF2612 domain-containing protein n=1 Tax=Moellerella wisconsensis TaxID=158849 RepID=UPI003AB073FE